MTKVGFIPLLRILSIVRTRYSSQPSPHWLMSMLACIMWGELASHSTMICTARPFRGPTIFAVAFGECCNFPISLNVHLISRSSIMTVGQDSRCCCLRFLPAKVKNCNTDCGLANFVIVSEIFFKYLHSSEDIGRILKRM